MPDPQPFMTIALNVTVNLHTDPADSTPDGTYPAEQYLRVDVVQPEKPVITGDIPTIALRNDTAMTEDIDPDSLLTDAIVGRINELLGPDHHEDDDA